MEKAKEEASPVESKTNQSDENEDENSFERLQIRIERLHDELILEKHLQSRNAKSVSQSIHKQLEAMNMLKSEMSATVSNATCPQSGQASQASDELQAAATSARQVCARAKTKMSARQPCAHQNSWQIPPAGFQEGGTNTISSNIPHENESGKGERYEHGDEDGNEPEPDPDEDKTKNVNEIDEEVTTNSGK